MKPILAALAICLALGVSSVTAAVTIAHFPAGTDEVGDISQDAPDAHAQWMIYAHVTHGAQPTKHYPYAAAGDNVASVFPSKEVCEEVLASPKINFAKMLLLNYVAERLPNAEVSFSCELGGEPL